jgi:hypothetical protein
MIRHKSPYNGLLNGETNKSIVKTEEKLSKLEVGGWKVLPKIRHRLLKDCEWLRFQDRVTKTIRHKSPCNALLNGETKKQKFTAEEKLSKLEGEDLNEQEKTLKKPRRP